MRDKWLEVFCEAKQLLQSNRSEYLNYVCFYFDNTVLKQNTEYLPYMLKQRI